MNWIDRVHVGDCRVLMRRMIADGQIEAIQVGGGRWGGTYRITEEALAQYIERQTVEAPA